MGAGDEHDDLIGRQVHGVLRAEEDAVGDIQKPERMGDFGDRPHAAAHHRDTAPAFPGEIENQLHAVDGGTEAGDQDAARGAVEDLLHARADGAFALGVAGAV
jgi:hypothetical protein